MGSDSIVHAFTVDLEDWYHGIELPFVDWHRYEPRIEVATRRLLDLLDDGGVKATFFTLGWIGERHPDLVREISRRGHEIGSHGYSHEKVYHLGPDRFRHEVRRTREILEEVSGTRVTTHRSPFFTITPDTLWAFDILAEERYVIDCSVSPVKTWRYGLPASPDHPYRVVPSGIVEFPVSTFRVAGRTLGIGGAYFRIFPYGYTRSTFRWCEREGRPGMFYTHPWEYDPGHPKVRIEWKAWLTHYANLGGTASRAVRLLSEFRFGTVSDVMRRYAESHALRDVPADVLKG